MDSQYSEDELTDITEKLDPHLLRLQARYDETQDQPDRSRMPADWRRDPRFYGIIGIVPADSSLPVQNVYSIVVEFVESPSAPGKPLADGEGEDGSGNADDGESSRALTDMRQRGFRSRTIAGTLATGLIACEKLAHLAESPYVIWIEGTRPQRFALNESIPEIHADAVHKGLLPENHAYTGKGVIVGVVDSGIDYQHADFRDADNHSRILLIGEQRINPDGSLGIAEYSQGQINSALGNANPFSIVNHKDTHGHGTAVAGVAAGGGRSKPLKTYIGVAPDADIIMVRNIWELQPGVKDDRIPFGDSNDTIAAIDFVVDRAKTLKQAVVVNLSQGDDRGPHNGTSLMERMIEHHFDDQGVAVVVAAGNEANVKRHANCNVSKDTWSDVIFTIKQNQVVAVLEVWYDSDDRFDAIVSSPSKGQTEIIGTKVSQTASLSDGSRVTIDSRLGPAAKGGNHIVITLEAFIGGVLEAGNWTLKLRGRIVKNGALCHIWAQLGMASETDAPELVTGVNEDTTVTVPGTSSKIITVGSYVSKENPQILAHHSGHGPTRAGVVKPDLVAPGHCIIAANSPDAPAVKSSDANPPCDPKTIKNGGAYGYAFGTSISAPHVAGAIALIFEKNPKLKQKDIRDILLKSAVAQLGAGAAGANQWGKGRLDVRAAIAQTPKP